MNVAHVLKLKGAKAATLWPDDNLQTAAQLLGSRRTGLAVVTDATGKILGVISAMDIMRAVGDHGEDAATMPVKEVMTSEVAVCCPQDSVQHALEQMVARRIRHLPVVDDGIVKGVIRLRDAVEFRVGEVEVETDDLRRYIYGAGITDRIRRGPVLSAGRLVGIVTRGDLVRTLSQVQISKWDKKVDNRRGPSLSGMARPRSAASSSVGSCYRSASSTGNDW